MKNLSNKGKSTWRELESSQRTENFLWEDKNFFSLRRQRRPEEESQARAEVELSHQGNLHDGLRSASLSRGCLRQRLHRRLPAAAKVLQPLDILCKIKSIAFWAANFNGSLQNYLMNVSFTTDEKDNVEFNQDGDVLAHYDIMNFQHVNRSFSYVKIGDWNNHTLNFTDEIKPPNGTAKFSSVCSKPCPAGAYKVIKSRSSEFFNQEYCIKNSRSAWNWFHQFLIIEFRCNFFLRRLQRRIVRWLVDTVSCLHRRFRYFKRPEVRSRAIAVGCVSRARKINIWKTRHTARTVRPVHGRTPTKQVRDWIIRNSWCLNENRFIVPGAFSRLQRTNSLVFVNWIFIG